MEMGAKSRILHSEPATFIDYSWIPREISIGKVLVWRKAVNGGATISITSIFVLDIGFVDG